MKLYTTPGGRWAGTEKDWKAALKAEGIDPKTYAGTRQIEVPTSKAELMEFLTFYSVNVISPGASFGPDAAGGGAQPPAPPPVVPNVEELRALHNPDPQAVTTLPQQIVTNTAGEVLNLTELFTAAPIPKQVELAVGLLDRLEAKSRNR